MLASVRRLHARRPVAQLAEHRSPKPGVGGSIPSWPARFLRRDGDRGRRWFGAKPRQVNEGVGQSVKTARLEHTRDASSQVTGWISRSRVFLAQVKNEMERVTWPTRKEVDATTVVVMLTSAFFGLYLSAIDVVLVRFARFLFNVFGAQ